MKRGLSWVVALAAVVGSCTWFAYVASSTGPAFGARWSDWLPTVRLLLIGVLCLASTAIALRNRNWFAFLFHAAVALCGVWFALSSLLGWADQKLPFSTLVAPSPLVPAICLLIIPGAFWYITGRSGWPAIVSGGKSWVANAAVLIGLVVSTAAGAAGIDFMTIWNGECHYSPQPFTKQLVPQQAAFTAHVIASRRLWGSDSSQRVGPRRYLALASVGKHFWGLPWWDHHVVLLLMFTRGTEDPFLRGETDFVDGRRLPGSLTRFLPIFDTFCTRTDSMAAAEVDLRVLRDGPPQNGVRLLGRTIRLTPDHHWETVPKAKVEIKGPAGTKTAESDEHGVYDVTGLPSGYYEVSRPPVGGAPPSWRDVECRWRQVDPGDIRDCAVEIR